VAGCSPNPDRIFFLEHKVDSLSHVLLNTQNVYQSSYTLKLDIVNPLIKVINTEFDTCSLGKVIENTSRLYFHYSDVHCSTCLDQQLLNLQEYQSKFGSESICILGSVQSYRSIVALGNIYDLSCDIFLVPNQQSIFKHNPFFVEPFYFSLTKRGEIDMFHFPLAEDSITTDYFLQVCHQRISMCLNK